MRRRSARQPAGIGLTALVLLLLLVAAIVRSNPGLVSPGQATAVGAATATPLPATPAASGTTSSAWYQLYFTAPVYPDDAKNHRGGLDEKLVALMDQSQKTLDVADYDFDLANVADAMSRAAKRGVRVRMVTDTDTFTSKDSAIQAAFAKLRLAGIKVVDDQRPPIMHDKYTIVDGEWLSTGSWNYTDGDTYHLNNWMGVFHSAELAARYTADFEQMFLGEFASAKAKKLAPRAALTIDGDRVDYCFSPGGECAKLIVETINAETRSSIYFLAFSFTHDAIGKAMIDKAKANIPVSGVFETTGSQTSFSEYPGMKAAGLDVYTDGNPWTMHHKVIILDERLVIAGSFNFSNNADQDNDENLLIIHDAQLAKAFKGEFDRVLYTAEHPPAK